MLSSDSCAHTYPHSSEQGERIICLWHTLAHSGTSMLICWQPLNRLANQSFVNHRLSCFLQITSRSEAELLSCRFECRPHPVILPTLLMKPENICSLVRPWSCWGFWSFFNFHNSFQWFIRVTIFSALSLCTDWLFLPSTLPSLPDNDWIK